MTNSFRPSDSCVYCGLPVAPSNAEDRVYCCLGCRIADSLQARGDETAQNRWALAKLGIAIFFAMNVMMFTMALWSWDVYDISGDTALVLRDLLRYACMAFASPVLILLGGPLFESAWDSLRKNQITTDQLLAIGVIAAFAYSTFSLLKSQQHVYFEVACMILIAVTVGRWMEATGKLKANQALQSMQKLLPEQVRRIGPTSDQTVELHQVEIGDLVRVLPGERIPLDGILVDSAGDVDEQIVTGESQPVCKSTGDGVVGGTLNLSTEKQIRVTSTVQGGMIQRMMNSVAASLEAKTPEQKLADRLTHWFVPAVALLAAFTFASHYHAAGFQSALMSSLAVVLIACPCALAIATPLALWAAMGLAAQRQVLFRNGDALGKLAKLNALCFDKTGTLTSGAIRVKSVEFSDSLVTPADAEFVWTVAHWLSAGSSHALATAIRMDARARDANNRQFEPTGQREERSGQGVLGLFANGDQAALGSLRFLLELGFKVSPALQEIHDQATAPTTCIGWNRQVQAVFLFDESMRPEAAEAMDQLRRLGLHLEILTGDRQHRAAAIANQLGMQFQAELLPNDKLERIKQMRQQRGAVGMVGDGINDAPALAEADLGLALDCGADVSRDAADICLLGSTLERLPWMIQLARKTKRTIRQNLFWAFAYNVVGIGLASSGMLSPIFSAVAMVGSSLFVIGNSLRLTANAPETASSNHDALMPPASVTHSQLESKDNRSLADLASVK
ncbi:MAG: cation-translocating P-type ATPase [Planctomycetales bacterium]|nr:cation-translocating P-type ATPase [Planctomycetales bacterium]